MIKTQIQLAAQFVKNADAIVIGAGAGMGRDSGLPDFRGNQGFWKNYPPYKGKFNFYQCANPQFLNKQPNLFWGFYGSRLQMYRKTQPHKGFQILLDLQKKLNKKIFVVTSNVDGHFQKAGFKQDKVHEIHGSINYLQCDRCLQLKQNDFQPIVDYNTMSCENLPYCSKCKDTIMRPNILMFYDYTWMNERSQSQEKNYQNFIQTVYRDNNSLCMIQLGAGTAIPTIRKTLQKIHFRNKGSKFVRINPDSEDQKIVDKDRFVHLQKGALQALSSMAQILMSQ